MTLMKESKMVYNAFKSEIALIPVDDYLEQSKKLEQKKKSKKTDVTFHVFLQNKKNQVIRVYQIIYH